MKGKVAGDQWMPPRERPSEMLYGQTYRFKDFQPTKDGEWSSSPITIVKFMELLPQLRYNGGETKIMGK